MKKNPLEEIYSSQVLLNEETGKTSNVVVPAGQQEIAKGGKVGLAKGQGLEKVKDVEDPEEAEGTKILTGEPKKLNDSMEKPTRSFEGSFEKLFKATINEEMGEEPEIDMEVEIPTSNEDMVDELEGSKDEVSDLVSDLKAVMDHLQGILDKVSGEMESEGTEEESEFGEEGEESSETEEDAVKEATDLKAVSDAAGKKLLNKNNKVGSLKPKGGKVDSGELEIEPDLKPAKAFDKSLQNTKNHAVVRSNIQKGEFFK
jgi:hypothetical protein